MPTEKSAQIQQTEALQSHQALVNRISVRAQQEGSPLTSLELQQFDSDRMSKDEYQKFDERFNQEYTGQAFLDRVSGILSRAIAEDSATDQGAALRYDGMVHQLEDRPESFVLWACCVPALRGYKSNQAGGLRGTIIQFVIVLAILAIILRILKIF
jgi:hypothetical protein